MRHSLYRTVTSSTVQYASVQFQSDLAAIRHAQPYSVRFATVRGEAATPILHGPRPDGNTGIALRRMHPYNSRLIWLRNTGCDHNPFASVRCGGAKRMGTA